MNERRRTSTLRCVVIMIAMGVGCASVGVAHAEAPTPLTLKLRTRSGSKLGEMGAPVSKLQRWDPKSTAIIVCDMWDQHWCQGAARRVVELAGPMNAMLKLARAQGVFIIHAPSTTTGFYAGTPQRKAAESAPFAATPLPLATVERWGTAWCYPDASREPAIPIDDTDMGCDCPVKCTIRSPWTRQIAAIEIGPADAVTDNGQETWNLLTAGKIDHVLICGVHLNMCVLGRPFAIRQLVHQGKQVVLIRDMTDTMYNHEMRPKVDHFTGTDLMVAHVERYWCPSIESSDLTGAQPFRFREDQRQSK